MKRIGSSVRHGIYVVLAGMINMVVVPQFRAQLLALFGARIGKNVRVGSCRLINLASGFRNLNLADDVFIGSDCLLDLEGKIFVERGAVLAPRVVILTHQDPGSFHTSPLCEFFPPTVTDVSIGAYAWIGSGSTVLPGANIGPLAVVGAMSLVRGDIAGSAVHVGTPARELRKLVRGE